MQLNLPEFAWYFAYIFTLFLCVVLHEYGHALAARSYGVSTRDIILSPIGGLARLESIPREPRKELVIAIAGPLVNVVIFIILAVFLFLTQGSILPLHFDFPTNTLEFCKLVLLLNAVLFFFNLVPAFPMDGGRIFRALLAYKFEYKKATFIASRVGRIFAVLFVIYAFYSYSFVLGIIGVFIFIAAGNEYKAILRISLLDEQFVVDIANKDFHLLRHDDYLSKAIDLFKNSDEKSFLVIDEEGTLVGSLPKQFLEHAVKSQMENVPVNELMSQRFGKVAKDLSIRKLYHYLDKNHVDIAAVVDLDKIIATVDREAVKKVLRKIQ